MTKNCRDGNMVGQAGRSARTPKPKHEAQAWPNPELPYGCKPPLNLKPNGDSKPN